MRNNSKNENDKVVTEGFLEDVIDRLMKYIDFKIRPFEEMEKNYNTFKNQTFKNIDWLVGQYRK